ncbi:hypothetical protein EDB82DRAFT_344144 [Fusarium venenatum]|uniref:uncharacterized protein n=1 Tax=Fusarium venenatum TaxID=56646 RepID=UPI001DD0BC7E|nr:hypothetical protein EDB82DRAFT_344144 [Fusarium venenatum]
MEPLPSHRELITALICSISAITPSTSDNISSTEPLRAAQLPTLSPLQAVSPSQRPLLLTLHVLFPSLLLPALDLLDRGLVARLVRSQELDHDSPLDLMKNDVFLVRSLATTISRRPRDVNISSKRYIVHLNAWNCSCASFTFDAFPGHHMSMTDEAQQLHSEEGSWSFGGTSMGPEGNTPPCCKHLLACLLVDKWSEMLGMYVEDRVVSREDMAGIIADM